MTPEQALARLRLGQERLLTWAGDPNQILPPMPDDDDIGFIVRDCEALLDNELDTEERMNALARIVPFLARGEDVAKELGFTEP